MYSISGFILKFFQALIIVAILLFTLASMAAEWSPIELQELSVQYINLEKINDKARNFLTWPESPTEKINVLIDTNILTHGYWNSKILSQTTDAQFRSIGLETHIGVRLTNFLDMGYYHYSDHAIDRNVGGMPKFPVEDGIELRIYLYRAKDANSIF